MILHTVYGLCAKHRKEGRSYTMCVFRTRCNNKQDSNFQISLDRGTNVIICVFMPNVTLDDLPGTLRMITKTVTCLKWNPDPKAQVFWLMLHKGLVDDNGSNSEKS